MSRNVHRSYDSQLPRMVLVLGYQRTGSSFTGLIFKENPQVFYTFEPVDSVYTHLYGTEEGWNAPTDIAFHHNGTKR